MDSREEFFSLIQEGFDKRGGLDGEMITRAVLQVFYRRIGSGQMDDDIKGLFTAASKSLE